MTHVTTIFRLLCAIFILAATLGRAEARGQDAPRSALARRSQRERGSVGFSYQPLTVPTAAEVRPTTFVTDLPVLCAALGRLRLDTPGEASSPAPSSARPPDPAQILRAIQGAPEPAAAATAAPAVAAPAPPPAPAAVLDLFAYLRGLQPTCAKLTSSGVATLTPPDVLVLRELYRSGASRTLADATAVLDALAKDSGGRPDPLAAARAIRGMGTAQSAAGVLGLTSGLSAKIVDGLADVLVRRAKAEAIRYVREQFTDRLCSDPAAEPFLVETCRTLRVVDASVSLQAVGTALHAAALRDLRRLPDVALAFLAQHARDKGSTRTFAALGRLTWLVFREVDRGGRPLELLAALYAVDAAPLACTEEPCAGVLRSLRVASALIHAAQFREDWTSRIEGWARQPAAHVPEAVALWVIADARLDEAGHGRIALPRMRRAVRTMLPTLARLARSEDAFRSALEPADAGVLAPGSWPTADSSQAPQGAPVADRTRATQRSEGAKATVRATEAAWALVRHLHESAGETVEDPWFAAAKVVARFGEHLVEEDYGEALFVASDLARVVNVEARIPEPVVTAIPLIIEIAGADSSREVAAVLDAAAAPVGSYRVKFQRPVVAITALFGGGGGLEYVSAGGSRGTSGMAAGLASLGLHGTLPWGRCDRCKRATLRGQKLMNVGLMFSLLDLGALTTYRVSRELSDGGAAESSPEVGVAQIFSPGAAITLGLFRSPVVLVAGLSLSPRLRRVDPGGTAVTRDVAALRVLFGVALDLTLLSF